MFPRPPMGPARSVPAPTGSRPACPVCGESEWSARLPLTALCRCRGCGTYLHDRSSSREEEEERYRRGCPPPARDMEEVAESQWRWLRRLLPAALDSPRILDVGCGAGAFLRAARAGGAQVAGLELDPLGAAACEAEGISVTRGSLFEAGIPRGPWDVVTLWDVLDHLELPARALELAAAELASGGLVVVRGRNAAVHAPARAAYARLRGLAGALRIPDISVVHRWGLTPRGCVALLRQAGFEEVRLYPALPTPGDRYAVLGPRLLAAGLKQTLQAAGMVLHAGSSGRVYPFPSVLITGRRLGA